MNTKSFKSSVIPSKREQRIAALDRIDWYRRCLEDLQDGRSVRNLDEAKLGYDRAMETLRQ